MRFIKSLGVSEYALKVLGIIIVIIVLILILLISYVQILLFH
jgi:hypothetical protein